MTRRFFVRNDEGGGSPPRIEQWCDCPAATMDIDQFKRVEELFNAALDLPAEQRDAFLERAGERISRHAPYGYQFDSGNQVVEDRSEQRTIATVQQLRAQGMSIRSIRDKLSERGICNRNGQAFGLKVLHSILTRAA